MCFKLGQNSKAFSLIELMVVVALLAILAAMSLPMYRENSLRVEIAKVTPVLDHYIRKSQDYYTRHGSFGTANEIGLDAGAEPQLVANAEEIYEYANSIVVDTHCSGAVGEVGVDYDWSALGLPGTLYVWYRIAEDHDGVISVTCAVHSDTAITNEASIQYAPYGCTERISPTSC